MMSTLNFNNFASTWAHTEPDPFQSLYNGGNVQFWLCHPHGRVGQSTLIPQGQSLRSRRECLAYNSSFCCNFCNWQLYRETLVIPCCRVSFGILCVTHEVCFFRFSVVFRLFAFK